MQLIRYLRNTFVVTFRFIKMKLNGCSFFYWYIRYFYWFIRYVQIGASFEFNGYHVGAHLSNTGVDWVYRVIRIPLPVRFISILMWFIRYIDKVIVCVYWSIIGISLGFIGVHWVSSNFIGVLLYSVFILVLLKFKLFGYHWVSLSINGIHLLQKVCIVVHCSIIRVQFGFIWVSLEFSELFGYMYLPLGLIVVLMVSTTYIRVKWSITGVHLGSIS